MSRTLRGLVLTVVTVSLAGCNRQHLSPAFGRAYRETLAMQGVNSTRAPPPSMRLDTQEAAVISGSYVQSLSGKGRSAEPEPVLLIAPQTPGGARPQQLMPSVPKE